MKITFQIIILYLLQLLLVNSFDINKDILFESVKSDTDPREIGDYFSKFAAFSYCSTQRVKKSECCLMEDEEGKKGLPNEKGKTVGEWTLVEHDTSHVNSFKD